MTRITPLAQPYPAALAPALNRLTPRDGEAPMLFRIVGTSQRAWDKFTAGSLLDKGPLPIRERELVIFRTAARIGADYEWGMHAALFAQRCGIDDDQLDALAKLGADEGGWGVPDAALVATVDALIDDRRLSNTQYKRLAAHFTTEQQLEIVQLVGFYQGVALIVGAFDIRPEPGTPHIPV